MSDSPEKAILQLSSWRHHGEPLETIAERLSYASSLDFEHLLNHLPFRL